MPKPHDENMFKVLRAKLEAERKMKEKIPLANKKERNIIRLSAGKGNVAGYHQGEYN